MPNPVLSATGLWTPPASISNDELVATFNAWVDAYNRENEDAIARGELNAKEHSSAEFIEKASGIKSRFVIDKVGPTDPAIMAPRIPERPDAELSVLAEMAVHAAKDALTRAGRDASEVDAVICAASNMQRPYPAMAIEVQAALGIKGFAFDMNVACSSATFGIQTACDMVRAGSVKSVLMVNPEICSGHLNFRDRDSHFIFGDVATAVLIESPERAKTGGFSVLGTRLSTQFSNNIRNNFGFLNRAAPEGIGKDDKLFVQEGRKVFKEVVPLVAGLIGAQLDALHLKASELKRFWLHQANANMNRLIAQKVLGRVATEEESPSVLDTYANTSSAGSVIAFHKYSSDFATGDTGLLCSFGAGYSAGTVVLQRR